ncbi:hypothetical protein ScPMuIL_008895 [Solemya velum]
MDAQASGNEPAAAKSSSPTAATAVSTTTATARIKGMHTAAATGPKRINLGRSACAFTRNAITFTIIKN